jgi:hypothetical protein
MLLLTAASLLTLAVNSNAQIQNFILRTSDPRGVAGSYGLVILRQLGAGDNYLVSGPSSVLPNQLLTQVQTDPRVKNFEMEGRARHPEKTTLQPPPSVPASLKNRAAINFYGDSAWNSYVNQPWLSTLGKAPSSGRGFVAVIDTGVDPNHPVLKRWLVPGYDFTTGTAGVPSELSDLDQSTAAVLNQSTAAVLNQSTAAVLDQSTAVVLNQSTAAVLDQSTAAVLNSSTLPSEFGHGTMVAGLIHLLAPTAKIMPLKAFKADGTANISDIVSAIYYAANNGADVINMSFSQDAISAEIMRAINYANRQGAICVASTGNLGETTLVYPAAFGGVMGVASVSASGALSTFSNYGPDITTLTAPGENLITTYPGAHYASVSGTSFSAAIVSGAVADLYTSNAAAFYNCLASSALYTPNVGFGLFRFNKLYGSACIFNWSLSFGY